MRVDLGVAAGVVPLDVLELGGVLEGGMLPVQVTHPQVQTRVARTDIPNVALEVLDVDRIETNKGDIARNHC